MSKVDARSAPSLVKPRMHYADMTAEGPGGASAGKWGAVDVIRYAQSRGVDPKKAIFLFPGEVGHHHANGSPKGGLKGLKEGDNALMGLSKDLHGFAQPTLSLPVTGMNNPLSSADESMSKGAIAELYRQAGAGYSFILPVRPFGSKNDAIESESSQGESYFSKPLDYDNDSEPDFWGNKDNKKPNTDLSSYYEKQFNVFDHFLYLQAKVEYIADHKEAVASLDELKREHEEAKKVEMEAGAAELNAIVALSAERGNEEKEKAKKEAEKKKQQAEKISEELHLKIADQEELLAQIEEKMDECHLKSTDDDLPPEEKKFLEEFKQDNKEFWEAYQEGRKTPEKADVKTPGQGHAQTLGRTLADGEQYWNIGQRSIDDVITSVNAGMSSGCAKIDKDGYGVIGKDEARQVLQDKDKINGLVDVIMKDMPIDEKTPEKTKEIKDDLIEKLKQVVHYSVCKAVLISSASAHANAQQAMGEAGAQSAVNKRDDLSSDAGSEKKADNANADDSPPVHPPLTREQLHNAMLTGEFGNPVKDRYEAWLDRPVARSSRGGGIKPNYTKEGYLDAAFNAYSAAVGRGLPFNKSECVSAACDAYGKENPGPILSQRNRQAKEEWDKCIPDESVMYDTSGGLRKLSPQDFYDELREGRLGGALADTAALLPGPESSPNHHEEKSYEAWFKQVYHGYANTFDNEKKFLEHELLEKTLGEVPCRMRKRAIAYKCIQKAGQASDEYMDRGMSEADEFTAKQEFSNYITVASSSSNTPNP